MTQAEKFKFEMMATPELALEMRKLKHIERTSKQLMDRYKDGVNPKMFAKFKSERNKAKTLHRKLESIIKSRQLTLF